MSDPRALRSSPWFLGALALAIAWWLLDLAVLRAGVPHPLDDTWEDGIVARLLVEGHGFRTHMIFPPLWELRDPATLTVPVVVHGPLLPLLLAIPLRLGGPGLLDHIAWFGAACAVLTLVPLFRLARRFFGEPVAAGACALVTLSPLVVDAVNHYVSMVLGALLVTWTLDLIARDRPRVLAGGLVAGVCSLTRPEIVTAAPILAMIAAWSATRPSRFAQASDTPASNVHSDRLASDQPRTSGTARGFGTVAIFLAAFVLAASWWWWERWRAVGSPFFNLTSYLLASFSPAHPGDALVRDFGVPPRLFPQVLADALPTLGEKWAHTFPRAIRRALGTPADALGWLVPIGLAAAWWRRDQRALVSMIALLAAIPLVAITLIAPVRLYPVPFLPISAIAAVLGARWLLERMPWTRRPRAWLLLLAILAIPSGVIELREQARLARSLESWIAFDRAALARDGAPDGARTRPMFSDTPDFVAWTTGRPTVWLTRRELESVLRGGGVPGLPSRPAPEDTWFHRDDARDPTEQRGYRLSP